MENNNNFNNTNDMGNNNNPNNTNENPINNENSINTEQNMEQTVIQDVEFKTTPHQPIDDYSFKTTNESSEGNGNYNINNNKSSKRKREKKPFLSMVAVALVCAIVGGGVGAGATYGLMRNSINEAVEAANKKVISSTPTALTSAGSIDIPSIVDRVSDAVVGVSTTSQTTNIFGFGTEQEGLGSGVIFSEDGYVLTNYHVVKGANTVKVILSTGQEVEAKVVNYDENADLAVVKITEDMKMPGVAELGDSDNLKVGEQVIAIGNPLGKEYLGTVTTGIISALSREVQNEDGTTMTLMQTDTAINSGNSGGPLINSAGQVIGINTAKIQGAEGIGFAIPINDAISKLDVLVKQKITLGVTVIDITSELAKANNLPEGVYIKQVNNFSIAEKGGLQAGDVIVKFGGQDVKTVAEINKIKEKYNDGDTIPVEFVRNGKTMTATLTVQ